MVRQNDKKNDLPEEALNLLYRNRLTTKKCLQKHRTITRSVVQPKTLKGLE